MSNQARQGRIADDANAEIVLGLLAAVDRDSNVTQRSVARELGIALGLANAYLKRCVRKGYIKISQAPTNRYAYYLTPKGFSEKSRLTARYLTTSFAFFRNARSQCAELLADAAARGWTRLALAGTGDLAEIATLCARDQSIDLVGIIAEDAEVSRFAGLPVVPTLADLPPVDAVVVTDFNRPNEIFAALTATMDPERVLVPRFIKIVPLHRARMPEL